MTRRNAIYGWHFVGADLRLAYDASDVTVAPGYVYTYDGGPLQHCEDGPARGLFACRDAFDALSYANGPVICRVRSWGDVIERRDKLVSRHREVVAMANVESELRLFACWCVRQVWHLLTDERSRKAIDVAEAFACGAATREELTAARDAAWDAARAIAKVATWDDAKAVAWDAARAAAIAAEDIAWGIIWVTARDVAGATRGNTMDAQRVEFERRMLAAVK